MNLKITYLFFIALIVIACKSETKNNSSEIEDISLLDTLQLKLNNGDKWLVNNETHEGLVKMDSIIKDFKLKDQKDYLVLGQDLSKQTSLVIKNCSMKGEPHDQLHVVLVPMLDEISILKESNDIAETKLALSKLERLISNYFGHFKL